MATRARKPEVSESSGGASRLQLAQIMSCTTREIHYLAEEGIVVKIGRGRYNFVQSIRNYIVHLRERAAGRESKDGKVDVVTANAAFKHASTRLVELRIAEREGRMISIPEVESVWSSLVIDARGLVASIPNRIRSSLPALTPADHGVIERIVKDVLEDMALTEPENPPLEQVIAAAQQE